MATTDPIEAIGDAAITSTLSAVRVSKPPQEDFWKEFVKIVLISVIIIVPFRLFVAQPFVVEGASMDPTFENGDYLIVDELTYHFHTPERGSVLIFKFPEDPKRYFIKRVIGLPGDTVSIHQGVITIFNADNPDGLVLDEPYVVLTKNETREYKVGEEEYFVIGDNRRGSADSRIWGPVPEDHIIGRPIVQFLPPRYLPGDYSQ